MAKEIAARRRRSTGRRQTTWDNAVAPASTHNDGSMCCSGMTISSAKPLSQSGVPLYTRSILRHSVNWSQTRSDTIQYGSVLSRHPRFGGNSQHWGKCWGSGGCAPSGVQGQSPWSEGMGAKPSRRWKLFAAWVAYFVYTRRYCGTVGFVLYIYAISSYCSWNTIWLNVEINTIPCMNVVPSSRVEHSIQVNWNDTRPIEAL